jgi:hypothetical protein
MLATRHNPAGGALALVECSGALPSPHPSALGENQDLLSDPQPPVDIVFFLALAWNPTGTSAGTLARIRADCVLRKRTPAAHRRFRTLLGIPWSG